MPAPRSDRPERPAHQPITCTRRLTPVHDYTVGPATFHQSRARHVARGLRCAWTSLRDTAPSAAHLPVVDTLAEASRSKFTMSPTTIFSPASTPAAAIGGLAALVIGVTALIFVSVAALLVYAVFRFKKRRGDDGSEPAQVYGSNRVEVAWTVIPILIVTVLFLASARVITSLQNAVPPADSIQVVAVGHQFWWNTGTPRLASSRRTSCTSR
jgi:Cytochrome C oxidase subunit II, transmembrane domain